MIRDFVLALATTFVVEPFQAEMAQTLAAAQAPQAIVRDIGACAAAAGPALADRALSDPLWGVTTVVGVWVGTTPVDGVLRAASPACGPALAAARPFLTGRGA